MVTRKLVGQVTPEEKDEIQALFERRNGLNELAKIVILEGTDTNKEDGTYSSVANAIYTVDTEYKGVSIQIKMGVSWKDSGNWTADDDKEIVPAPTSVGIKVTSMRSRMVHS